MKKKLKIDPERAKRFVYDDDDINGLIFPICNECKHLHRKGHGLNCDAHPDRIPQEIIENKVDHHKPHKGDHGIQFELMSE
ncbi:MAG TPA: hypothetical protein VEG44_02580 [Candidatus Acidoferrales bacterium]|nr:hypothetical protein [Candidatus Acidoferrales bacterium]